MTTEDQSGEDQSEDPGLCSGPRAFSEGKCGTIKEGEEQKRSFGSSPEHHRVLHAAYRNARRIVVLVAGITLLLIGAALLVLPGPGIPMILAGLALLATEFVWARLWLGKLRKKAEHLAAEATGLVRGSGKH